MNRELRPYFELNHVMLDGVFFAAGKLYGLTFKERQICRFISPMSASSRSTTRMASRSHFSSAIIMRGHPSAAAPG